MNRTQNLALKLSLVALAATPALSFAKGGGSNSILLKGGMNLSKLDVTGASNGTGFGGGLGVDLGLAGMFGVEIDALYNIRKTKLGAGTAQVKNFELPVVAYWSPVPMFRLLAGGFYSMGLGKIKESIGAVSQDAPYAGFLKKADYGFTGGLGVVLPAGAFGVGLDIRYNLGLADRNDAGAGPSIKTRSIDFNVAFRF